ncbi:MAG: hypothetical protein HY801_03930 [Candidatus Lindowbacteria bacterium]|nr:hypothetical protein [Candidatus Lindowbacteria bacterium]
MTVTEQFNEARTLAREIVRTFAPPRFYIDLSREVELSKGNLHSHPVLERARTIVKGADEHFGHGLRHSEKVAIDAGAIVQNELARTEAVSEKIARAVFLVQLASLFHDIRRRMPDHARQSALTADEILADFPVERAEREWIVGAIRNHEAFIEPAQMECPEGQLLSDALYDADKFRWGPDNFSDTVWEMITPERLHMGVVLAHFPKGMEGIKRIATTFRTETGKKYGPEFIDIGMAIGQKLYEELLKRFPLENT